MNFVLRQMFLLVLVPFGSIFKSNCQSEIQVKKPNILFILADDMSYDSMGFMDRYNLETPNLDKLAEQGVRFTKNYNTTAICMASRAQIMTGLYEFSTGTNFLHGDLSYNTWKESYSQVLRNEGYYVGFGGKFGFNVKNKNGRKGSLETVSSSFDWWCGWMGQGSYSMEKNKDAFAYIEKYGSKKEHTTYALGLMGQDFIQEANATGKPFCLSISYKAPHTPYFLDSRYDKIYRDQKFPKPETFGKGHLLPKQAKSGRPYSKGKSWVKDYDNSMYKYHTMIYAMDTSIGLILGELEKLDLDKNTIIIFTSDNGHFNGSKSMGGKLYAYEEGSLAPTIIVDPRRTSNYKFETCTALSGNIDLAPTIIDYAGVIDSAKRHGNSLKSILDGDIHEIHESIMLINVWGIASAQSLAVVTLDFKYINWFYGIDPFEKTEELFDLKNDAFEQNEISKKDAYHTKLTEMRSLYDRWLRTWESETVSGAGYEKYARLGNRAIPFNLNSQEEIRDMYFNKKDFGKRNSTKKNKK
jgi:arylsulfatase A-like enzyme